LPAGEGKDDNVIKGPGVVLVWGVESQLVGGFLPKVNQEGGVDHGDGKAAHPFPFSNLQVVGSPFIEALEKNKSRAVFSEQRASFPQPSPGLILSKSSSSNRGLQSTFAPLIMA
jgi:hypothetical protein